MTYYCFTWNSSAWRLFWHKQTHVHRPSVAGVPQLWSHWVSPKLHRYIFILFCFWILAFCDTQVWLIRCFLAQALVGVALFWVPSGVLPEWEPDACVYKSIAASASATFPVLSTPRIQTVNNNHYMCCRDESQ